MQWWKYFDKAAVSNSDIYKVNIYLQIVAAMCNCYCPSLHKNSNAYCEIVQKMLTIKSRNSCTETCSSDNVLLHKSWLPLYDSNNCLHDFPKLTEDVSTNARHISGPPSSILCRWVQTRYHFTNIFSTIYIGCYSCPNTISAYFN